MLIEAFTGEFESPPGASGVGGAGREKEFALRSAPDGKAIRDAVNLSARSSQPLFAGILRAECSGGGRK